MMFDFISVGDTTLDTFLFLKEADIHCNLDKERCELCLNYADKIPVEKHAECIGGNAANAAVGASRLGINSAIFTILGDDETGHHAKAKFMMEKVSLQYIQIDKSYPTNHSTVIDVQGERTILIYHNPRNYILPDLEKTKILYLTSAASGSEKMFPDIINYLKQNGTKLVYQPGTFQLRLGREKSAEILKNCYALIYNKEEAQEYTKNPENSDIKKLLKDSLNLGPKIVVITDGKNGTYATDGKNNYFIPILDEAKRVEMTGAGDAFALAFAVSLYYNNDISEALRWGTFNAASVISKIGPQEGLLTKEQMEKYLKNYPDLKAQKI